MAIDRFLIEQIDTKSNLKTKVIFKVAQKSGTTIQKITQMLEENENRTLVKSNREVASILNKIRDNSHAFFEQISSISDNFYQGSIANVNKAILKDNRTVAIKSIRPNAIDNIKRDLSYSDSIISKTSTILPSDKFSDIEDFTKEFIKGIELECDLSNEIRNYHNFKKNFENFNSIALPKIYDNFSSKEIIVSDWIDETTALKDISSLPRPIKNNIANELCDLFFLKPFETGYIQEDSNLTNFIISQDKLFLIDLGKVQFIPLSSRIAFAKLLEVATKDLSFNYLDIYVRIGFNRALLEPIEHLLPQISSILFEPLLSDRYFDFNKWNPVKKINSVCGDRKWNFRSAAPMEYFSLTRSFFGFLKLVKKLDAGVNFTEIRTNILNEYKHYLDQYTPTLDSSSRKNPYNNKYLNIIVKRNGKEKVNLKLPANVLYEIDSFLSDRVKKEIRNRKTTIQDLIEDSIKDNKSEIINIEDKEGIYIVKLIS